MCTELIGHEENGRNFETERNPVPQCIILPCFSLPSSTSLGRNKSTEWNFSSIKSTIAKMCSQLWMNRPVNSISREKKLKWFILDGARWTCTVECVFVCVLYTLNLFCLLVLPVTFCRCHSTWCHKWCLCWGLLLNLITLWDT